SWIRDGSMTSAALLKFGMAKEVREFLAWYAPYQYENGMVPCVVDSRGPDPVPEHDSHGQLIFGLMEHFRFTRDTAFLKLYWPNIVRAVDHIQLLRAQRMTPTYRDGNDEQRAYYGLVTESISHEGYSAKPMHSYWDNFFVLKGFKDAAAAASALGDRTVARSYDSLATAFRQDLYASIALAMKNRGVDHIPGCVELGDFDATSTSIAMFPCSEFLTVPHGPFRRTFDRYYDWFQRRARGELQWDAYTPYEVRNVGTFLYLGQKARAHELLDWFLRDQRPQGWNHWAEVVWSDYRLPRFIGDMPHTWVGSDFINAVRAMFLYERDDDGALVIGGGLKEEWVREGIGVQDLPTHGGSISMRVTTPAENVASIRLSGTVDASRHRILVAVDLLSRPLRGASVNGVPASPEDGFVRISRLPAVVELAY
ncbi:MAG: coagulation factor 5/8 type domain-containing protein, partial [Bacteroidota bacterium]